MLPENPHPLNHAELTQLDHFLHSAACGGEAMGLSYAHGFLTAVASGPERLETSEWLRLMFDEPVFETGGDGQHMLGLALRLFADIESGLQRHAEFNPVFEYLRDNSGATQVDAQPWCLGFSAGFALFSELWTRESRQALHSSINFILKLANINSLPEPSYVKLYDAVPEAAASIYRYWRANDTEQ